MLWKNLFHQIIRGLSDRKWTYFGQKWDLGPFWTNFSSETSERKLKLKQEELLRQSESLYYYSFPEEPKEENISKQLKRKLRNVDFSESERFLITVQNLTQVIFNNKS